MLHMQLIIGLISLGFFIITFEFIRKRYLREEYAILWLLTSLAIAILSLWPGLIDLISRITGFYYITAILIVVFVFLIAILMHYSIVISKIKEMNKELVQRYALLEHKVKELEEKNRLK
ncbi:MAG TPA: DUF2304 domain-containing protein [Syntrophorhabdaceae bacterium]|nr:DUF2304 domain-containing protein [Syntrophorhabdaceae bacterium]